MKNFTRLCIVLSLFSFISIQPGYGKSRTSLPYGESVIYTMGMLGQFVQGHLTITPQSVTINGNVVYQVPKELLLTADIVGVAPKLFTADVLVTLKNGTMIKLNYNPVTIAWEPVYLGEVPDNYCRKMIGDDLYVMTYNAVFVSDSGYNWVIDTAGLDGTYPKDIAIDTTQKVWLATQNGLFIQLLNITTWVKNTAHGPSNVDLVYVDRKQNVWTSQYNVLRVTVDGGLSFQNGPSGLPNYFIRKISDDVFGNIYVMYDSMLYYSQAGIQPFVKISQSLMADFKLSGTQYLFNDLDGDTVIYLATQGGLYSSANQGTTWTYVENAVRAEQINSVAATTDSRLLMTSNVGAFRLEANQTWSKRYPQTGFNADTKIYVADNGDIYLIAENKGVNSGNNFRRMVYKSTDNGNTFTTDTAGLTASDVAMSEFFVDESGVQHAMASVYVSGGPGELRVWKKTPGQPWALDTAGLSASLGSNFSPQCFGTAHSGKIYMAIRNSGSTNIYSRLLAGSSWTFETVVNAGVVNIKGRSGKVTIATDMGLIYNTGSTWNSASNPAAITGSITWSNSEVDNHGVVWGYFETVDNNGSIGEGIYYTTDFVSWREPEGNEDTLLFRELVAIGDSVFALTTRNGVYVFDTLHAVQVGVTEIASADNIKVVPNPFNSYTTLQFNLNVESRVALNIYNMLGESVFSMAPQQLNTGAQQLKINLPAVANGILLYELNINGKLVRGKLVQQ